MIWSIWFCLVGLDDYFKSDSFKHQSPHVWKKCLSYCPKQHTLTSSLNGNHFWKQFSSERSCVNSPSCSTQMLFCNGCFLQYNCVYLVSIMEIKSRLTVPFQFQLEVRIRIRKFIYIAFFFQGSKRWTTPKQYDTRRSIYSIQHTKQLQYTIQQTINTNKWYKI